MLSDATHTETTGGSAGFFQTDMALIVASLAG